MIPTRTLGKGSFLLAAIFFSTFLGLNVKSLVAAESGCVTCHINQEILKKNITPEQGQKSAMQSGAG